MSTFDMRQPKGNNWIMLLANNKVRGKIESAQVYIGDVFILDNKKIGIVEILGYERSAKPWGSVFEASYKEIQ